MCGIVGLRLSDRPVTREDLEAMNDRIVHRGPDGSGAHVDGPVGIAMRRLSIIDLEGGWQPIGNETGRIQVVQNGEIYNFRELRAELSARGHIFRTASDTEAIVHAYEEWGAPDFAHHLRGMFALAIYDSDRRELWLARDRLGIKPLFMAENARGFGFASEIKSLLASPLLRDPRVEPRALLEYLAFGNAGHDISFVRDVRPVPPGFLVRHKEGRTDMFPYWEFQLRPQTEGWTYEEARDQLRQQLASAVRSHLVSDVPVGAFLSGGIDSSAVVGLMARELGSSFKTFSIGFDAEQYNELPHARRVAQQWGTDHYEEIVRPAAVDVVDTLVSHFDEPFSDPSAIPTWYLARLAAEHVKVVLSGDGGDELFAGYDRYLEAYRDQWLDHVPRFLRRGTARMAHWLPDQAPGRYFLDYMQHDAQGRYAYQLDLFPGPSRQQLVRPELWHQELVDPTVQRARLLRQAGTRDLVAQCTFLDTKHYLPLDILTKVDRMTMAHSLESRPPLLDHQLVEFSARLPTAWKLSPDGVQKRIFKDAVRDLLPDAILQRRKAGFAVPLRHWFAQDLAPMFVESVIENALCHEYLNPAAILRLFKQNQSGRRDHGTKLWAILVFEIWLRNMKEVAHRSTTVLK